MLLPKIFSHGFISHERHEIHCELRISNCESIKAFRIAKKTLRIANFGLRIGKMWRGASGVRELAPAKRRSREKCAAAGLPHSRGWAVGGRFSCGAGTLARQFGEKTAGGGA